MSRFFIFVFLVLTSFCLLSGCYTYENPLKKADSDKTVLIYGAMAVADSVGELASKFERESGCHAEIVYGGSLFLKHAMEISKTGDIFIPAVGDMNDELIAKGIVEKAVTVGSYRLAYYVQKSNPMGLTGSLDTLTDETVRVAVGSVISSGVGEETFAMLEKAGIADKVLSNVRIVAADSRRLLSALKNNEADLIVYWRFGGSFKQDNDDISLIDIDSEFVRDIPVSVGVLKYASNRECVDKFMALTVSEAGKKAFRKLERVKN